MGINKRTVASSPPKVIHTRPKYPLPDPSFYLDFSFLAFKRAPTLQVLELVLTLGGTGHMQQMNLGKTNWKFRYSYGGVLRQKRAGRGQRPLSSREPLPLVLKVRREKVKYGLRTWKRFTLIHYLLKKYASKFFIKVEQVSIQGDHLHLLIRTPRRSNFQSFFRVFAGQIAQQFQKEGLLTVERSACVTDTSRGQAGTKHPSTKGLWKHRPFTRVVRGYRAYKIVRDYVQLNEKEALGQIPYRAERLKGLSNSEWEILWA